MTEMEVLMKKEKSVAVIRMNRPKALNALNKTMVEQMDRMVDAIRQDDTVRVAVFYGAEHFAAGADIKEMAECDAESAKAFSFAATFQKIAELEIPTIAAMEGYALGGGLELALACDIRLAADTLKAGFPEINLGIIPGAGGTIRAPKLMGEAAAKELIFSGEIIDAGKAFAAGLINRILPQERLLTEAMEFAERLSMKAPIALAAAKRIIGAGLAETDTARGIALEREAWASLFATEDQKEGMRAFLEKRKPRYGNK